MDVEDVMEPRAEICPRGASLAEVRRCAERSPERCVVVVAEADMRTPLGVLTVEQVEQALRELGEPPERVPAGRVLPEKLRSCWPSDAVEAAAAIMRAFGMRALPVIDLEHGLVGVVTAGHLVRRGALPREALALAEGEGAELLESA